MDHPLEESAVASVDAVERRQVRELELLYKLSRLLDQSLDLRDVVPPVLEALAEHMSLNHGTLTLLNRNTNDISIEIAHGVVWASWTC